MGQAHANEQGVGAAAGKAADAHLDEIDAGGPLLQAGLAGIDPIGSSQLGVAGERRVGDDLDVAVRPIRGAGAIERRAEEGGHKRRRGPCRLPGR